MVWNSQNVRNVKRLIKQAIFSLTEVRFLVILVVWRCTVWSVTQFNITAAILFEAGIEVHFPRDNHRQQGSYIWIIRIYRQILLNLQMRNTSWIISYMPHLLISSKMEIKPLALNVIFCKTQPAHNAECLQIITGSSFWCQRVEP